SRRHDAGLRNMTSAVPGWGGARQAFGADGPGGEGEGPAPTRDREGPGLLAAGRRLLRGLERVHLLPVALGLDLDVGRHVAVADDPLGGGGSELLAIAAARPVMDVVAALALVDDGRAGVG